MFIYTHYLSSFLTGNTYRLIHGLFHIALVISTIPWYRPRRLMTRAIWKRSCINLFITYFAKADNMLLPFTRGKITCYFHRKMLLPWRQITRHKLCFYYTCTFGVISIKYVNFVHHNCLLFIYGNNVMCSSRKFFMIPHSGLNSGMCRF